VNIASATGASYTTTNTDLGLQIRCLVTGTAGGSTATAFAQTNGAVQPAASAPFNVTPPSISPGSGGVGTAFTASTAAGDWSPATGVTFAYQWQRKNVATGVISNIAGATGTSYTSVAADNGNQVRAMVTATRTSDGTTGQAPTAFATVGTIKTNAVIWFISDAGSSSHAANVVANNIPAGGAGVDLVVYGGDMYARGTASDEASDITALYGPSGRNVFSKMVMLIGNHDWANRDCAGAYRAFVRANMPFMVANGMTPDGIGKVTIAGCDLIFLNTCAAATSLSGDCSESAALMGDSLAGIGAAQLAQLQTWMAAPGTNKIVFGHHQRYSAGQNHGDIPSLANMWAAMQPSAYGGNGGTLLHIHGHEHDYQRMRPRDGTGLVASDPGFQGPGVTTFCGGDGGEGNYDKNASYPAKYLANFRGSSTSPVYGAIRITISGNTITVDHFDEAGTTITDTVTVTTTSPASALPDGGEPSITNLSGAPRQGQSLTCDSGLWSGDVPMTFTFQWQRLVSGAWQNCVGTGNQTIIANDSDGTAQASYVVAPTDVGFQMRCRVTIANDAGSAQALTGATAAAVAPSSSGPPVLVTPPVVSPTIGTVGTAVAVSTGSWTSPTGGSITFAYQWYRVNPTTGARVAIAGATANAYTITALDVGFKLSATVSATNTGTGSGTSTADAAPTSPIASTSIAVNAAIDTRGGQTIQVGQPFTVVWEAHTNAPGGIIGSLIRIDGGAYQEGTLISSDGAGGGTYSFTFPSLGVGSHTIDVEALAHG
jgi:hypothetical protein